MTFLLQAFFPPKAQGKMFNTPRCQALGVACPEPISLSDHPPIYSFMINSIIIYRVLSTSFEKIIKQKFSSLATAEP